MGVGPCSNMISYLGRSVYIIENYTDYRFKELGRFDYTKQDCYNFHDAVKQHVLPLVNLIYQKKKD